VHNRAVNISTHAFAFSTAATPGQVWAALTDGDLTRRYLHGLAAESAWAPGSRLVLRAAGVPAATGEVLAAEPGARLSLALEGGHGADTYLTWTIRRGAGGSVVRLVVDEPDGDGEADEAEVEDVWLPVLADLHALLAGAEVR
jgi:uncharacterized protein YndB with AHSA1/START domain